ncbi:TonB-dependent receptor [Aerobium aerolatum]|uniref:Long-chain fatty acid transport protein n=1 Tax=Aquamicrobium aerolatum DSM 21857 TaxID=1121003 RepID=A0A1I3IXS1_9HYPH|nr:TonB-dependent receptor [Aquamicrobium aerolatum]SFI52759.1 Long-chain fatty acid transport protein [Aquamicrobium aerolatum DSM 21857]
MGQATETMRSIRPDLSSVRLRLLAGTALIGFALLAQPSLANDADCAAENCEGQIRGKIHDDARSHDLPVGANTERQRIPDQGSIPFSISVDGAVLETSKPDNAKGDRIVAGEPRQIDRERRTDLDLSSVDIQIKFDGLGATPLLNVATTNMRRSFGPGDAISFLATTNYPDFIERGEIRIYLPDDTSATPHPVAVLPVKPNATADWVMPQTRDEREFLYVLRVYDSKGRYDETAPLTLRRSAVQDTPKLTTDPIAPGMGEDRTAIRNIRVHGGAVTVYGKNVPAGHQVSAFGETVPVDGDDAFVIQRILAPGDHSVDVVVQGTTTEGGLHFSRDIDIPDNDWFYVGLADLTVGKRTGSKDIEAVRPGEYDSVYTKGRLAFYLKGKIKGEYLLTAAADTAEDDLDRIFKNLGARNPRHILRNLDPDDYYPVYGDDSTMIEDAPTNGKFYVRIERGDSHAMWGNFKTNVTGTQFLRNERALYGAQGVYVSPDSTEFGERRTEVSVYAAQPDTLPQRDEFRATGGSSYFLKRQNTISGSQTVTVEIRDPITGRVLERRHLTEGEDYRFDYLQGVILLNRPLSSTSGSIGPVRDGALGGNQVFLIAQYEYEPIATDVDGYSIGGRGQHWLGEHVRVGLTGMQETSGDADQKAGGVDVRLRMSERSYLDAEVAASRGTGFGLSRSYDGGLSQSDSLVSGGAGNTALAWRLKGRLDLRDIDPNAPKGTVGGYFEHQDAGFSTLDGTTATDKRLWGMDADLELAPNMRARLAYDDFSDGTGQTKRQGSSSLEHDLDERWRLSYGLTYTDILSPNAIAAGKSGYNGARLDGGVRLDYRPNDDHLYYAFGQATIDRSNDIDRNDRLGVGTEFKLTDTVGLNGEVSYGTHGLGGLAGLTYDPNANDQYYIAYRLDPDRAYDLNRTFDLAGTDRGDVVAGVRRRINDQLSAYSENSYDLYGQRRSLNQTYGVVYTPDERWTVNGGFEGGLIRDNTIDPVSGLERSDFERYAPSLSMSYKDDERGIASRMRGEARIEDSEDGTRDQNTYLFAGGLLWKTSENWRAMINVDAVWSDTQSSVTSYQDTRYAETSLGWAYRPVDNDRLNALFKYTWLYDLPGNGQRVSGATGEMYAPAQRSHILSADFTYDLVPWLSVGAKYGVRLAEVKYRTDAVGYPFETEWQRSSAHLGIIRADLHIVRKWDLLLEGRILHSPEAKTTDFGALAAVYRHVGDNFKVGIGYNFGRFSDDLRDLTMDDRGLFLNVVGKF